MHNRQEDRTKSLGLGQNERIIDRKTEYRTFITVIMHNRQEDRTKSLGLGQKVE